MSDHTREMERLLVAKRGGANTPLEQWAAIYDGRRSIRALAPQGEVGLATATYSYQLTHDERCDVAERITALWNLAALYGWSTNTILGMVEAKAAEAA